jgi:hypothetical protein
MRSSLKGIFSGTLLTLIASASFAQSDNGTVIKVIRVKKNTAVVVFSKKSTPLEAGQVGRVVAKDAGLQKDDEIGEVSRDRFIGMNAGLSMLQTKVDGAGEAVKNDVFDADIIYGWNKGTVEYGLLFKYAFDKAKETDVRSIEAGGLFDFNFKPNTVENSTVFGARLIATVGDEDSSAQAKGAMSYRIEPGIFIKWFGLSTNLAGIANLSYVMKNISYENAKTTVSGIQGRLGIQAYF